MLRRLAILGPLAALGCGQLIGLDEFTEAPASAGASGSGGAAGSSGNAGSSASGGSSGSGATSGSGGTGGVAPDCSQPEDCVETLGECDDKWTCPAGKCVKEFKTGGDTCSLGICSGKGGCGECIADSRRCSTSELGRPEVCDDTGHWVPALACAGDKPICDEGSCLGVTELSLGISHNCAVLTDGQVRCWGQNGKGQLGNGAKSAEESSPVKVANLADAVEVAAGDLLSCARLASSEVWCWGYFSVPTMDPGTEFDEEWLSPHMIGTNASQIAVSVGPCFLSGGEALCMGDGVDSDGGFTGELGEGGVDEPTAIQGLAGLLGVSRNFDSLCGMTASGVSCADHSNGFAIPVNITIPPNPRIKSGPYDTCIGSTTTEGDINCLAFGVPRIGIDTPFTAIKPAVGFDHACAISGGTAYCWGACDKGQCGEDRTSSSDVPNAVLSGVEDVYAGNKISCAKKTDGSVVCWGAITSTDVGYQPRPIQWN